jgi:hypothetical protein
VNFSLHHRVKTGSGAHPASYPMGITGPFHGGKRPGREAAHSPPSSAEVKERVELYLHSPSTPSWRGAQLKYRDNFTFNLPYIRKLLKSCSSHTPVSYTSPASVFPPPMSTSPPAFLLLLLRILSHSSSSSSSSCLHE